MSAAYDKGKAITEAIGYLKFLPSTNNYIALVTFPYLLFEEYVPDGNRMYERGQVVRVDKEKYLLQGDGRIDIDRPPPINSLCKLFRDGGEYDWVREEFCLKGFVRYWENPERPQDTGWYKVIADNAGDNNTPPPGVPTAWEKLDS